MDTTTRGSKRKKDATTPALPPLLRLPDALVEDILRRLPPKSLVQCRCVSPSWNALTTSPAFSDLYHASAAASAARFVSVPVERRGDHEHEYHRDPPPCAPLCGDCPRVFSGGGRACHGAVLVGRPCQGQFFACNPSTGGALRLPPRRPTWHFLGAGLGYHAAAEEHKAVVIECVDWPLTRGMIPKAQLVVFDVGAGGRRRRWRAPRGRKKAPVVYPDALVSAKTNPVFAGGSLHWLLSAPTAAVDGAAGEPRGILTFSCGAESVTRVPLPPSIISCSAADEVTKHTTLAELDGGLCCLVRDLRGLQDAVAVLHVWRLTACGSGGRSGTWWLEHRIDLQKSVIMELFLPWGCDIFLLCYVTYVSGESSGERKKMLLATTAQKTYMYDPDTGKLQAVTSMKKKDAGVSVRPVMMTGRLVLYQESIVHFDGMEYGKDRGIKFEFIDL